MKIELITVVSTLLIAFTVIYAIASRSLMQEIGRLKTTRARQALRIGHLENKIAKLEADKVALGKELRVMGILCHCNTSKAFGSVETGEVDKLDDLLK